MIFLKNEYGYYLKKKKKKVYLKNTIDAYLRDITQYIGFLDKYRKIKRVDQITKTEYPRLLKKP